jgi:hypothetical protein
MRGEHEGTLRLARRAEEAGLAGERENQAAATIGAADTGEAVVRVSTLEEAEDALMDDVPKEPVFSLIPLLEARLEVLPLM